MKAETSLEDVYDQLALLSDIDEFEAEVERGDVINHQEVISKSRELLH